MRLVTDLGAFLGVAVAAVVGGPEPGVTVNVEEEGDIFVYDPPQSEDPMDRARGGGRGDWRDNRGSVVATEVREPVVVDAGEEPAGAGTLESMPFARAKWPPPSAADFDSAPETTLARNDLMLGDFGDFGTCAARATRGWLRVVCKLFEPSLSVLGGSTNGVFLDATAADATMTMPLAPGDRRVLQISTVGQGYESGGLIAVGILSESWIGTEAPHVVITHSFVR
jgi:hypothetical protein